MLRIISIACLVLLSSTLARADIPASKSMLPDRVDNNLRFALDVSERGVYFTDSNEFATVEAIGFDLHKVVSSEKGDIGTFLLQGYFTQIDNLAKHPPFFNNKNDSEFVFRIFNFNYKVLPRNRLNIRIGHFEIPFGLEQVINTNGTLRDYIHGKNIGVKADWGLSANGGTASFEYEFAATRGTGNNWETNGSPYLYSGRIGTHDSNNFAIGFSFLSGDINPEGKMQFPIKRERLGIDLRWYFENFGLLAEHSTGKDEGLDARSTILELNTTGPIESWLTYLQWVHMVRDDVSGTTTKSSSIIFGNKWDVTRRWDLSIQLSHDIDSNPSITQTNILAAQVRYRF